MIVDVHHHPLRTLTEDGISVTAAHLYNAFGAGGRSQRISVPLEEIRRRLAARVNDPDGEKLLERMSKAGIDITIVCVNDDMRPNSTERDILAVNQRWAEFARGTNGKVVALAGIDPRRKEAPELLRHCIEEFGMRGLKWHPDTGFYPNSEAAYEVLKVAERLGRPLLIHTGPAVVASGSTAYAKYARVGHLDDVAQDFPGLKIIAAHMGRFLWREWAELARFRRNVYGDLAGWQTFAAASYRRFCCALREALDFGGADSVLFGTDGPVLTALVTEEEFVQTVRDLPHKAPPGVEFTDEEVGAILGGNAQIVFGL